MLAVSVHRWVVLVHGIGSSEFLWHNSAWSWVGDGLLLFGEIRYPTPFPSTFSISVMEGFRHTYRETGEWIGGCRMITVIFIYTNMVQGPKVAAPAMRGFEGVYAGPSDFFQLD